MAVWEFLTNSPVTVDIRVPAGSITVTATHTPVGTLVLDARSSLQAGAVSRTRVGFGSGTLSVISPSRAAMSVAVEVPEGSSVTAHTASADVTCTGGFGALDVRTSSGNLAAERVSGLARITTSSGDVWVGQVADAQAETASGDVHIGRAGGPLAVRTARGAVQVAAASGNRADITTASGDITVAVVPGIGVHLDLSAVSGGVRSDIEPSGEDAADMVLHCRTITGDVRVSRTARRCGAG